MPAKNYASTRYSELDQIDVANVDQLQLAWSFSNGVNLGQESVPLVINNTIYIVGPWPNSDWRCVLRRGQPRRRL